MNTKIFPEEAVSLIEQHLRSPEHSWSIGIPGAIAEFMYDADEEKIDINSISKRIVASTPRGALSINLPKEVHCLAYEEFSPCIKSWSQQIVFCLPNHTAKLSANHVLTELAPESLPELNQTNGEILFDLGLGSEYLRFCIYTNDAELLKALYQALGRAVFDADNTIMSAIVKKSPIRIISSALGSIEIYGKIPEKSETSPSGPHTHLLPKLLNAKNLITPLPDGLVPLLTLYPAHPLFDVYGEARAFDHEAYKHFQTLLHKYGLPEYCAEKKRLRSKNPGDEISLDNIKNISHWQRTAQRVTRIQQSYS